MNNNDVFFSLGLINKSLTSVFINLEPMYNKYNLCIIQFARKWNHIERSKSRNTLILKLNNIRHFRIFHNTRCFSSNILRAHCFQFLMWESQSSPQDF